MLLAVGTTRMRISRTTPFFAEFIGADVTPIIARATAKLAGTANICVLALNPADSNTLHMDKEAKVVATGCAVYSNSNHPDGVKIDSNASIDAALICSAGGVKAMTNAIRPSATTDCEVIPDPLASRVAPGPGACDFNTIALSKGSHTLSPGTYCKGLKISGSAKVTFKTGDYVVTGGRFEISGDASVVGENVAFYLHGENTTIQFTQNTSLSLTGASTGPMAGLLFFEDRKVSTGRQHRINSINAHRLTGTIYLSRGHLRIDPNSTIAQDSAYTAIIARTIEVDEGPTLVLNDDYDASNVPVPEGIKMSSQVVLTD